MKKIRLGNDIQFTWTVEGLSDTSGSKTVQLIDQFGHIEKIEYNINGDVITGTFYGKDQKHSGTYRLCLVVNEGRKDMATLDHVKAFLLVDISDFGIMTGSDDNSLDTAVLNLESFLKVEDCGIKSIIFSRKTEDGSNVYTVTLEDNSAYEVILPKGEKGDPGTNDYNDLINTPEFANVAMSGRYNDLIGKPTIPVVPTNVSAFNNDAGYLTSHQDISGKADKVGSATSGNFAALDGNGNLTDSGHKHSDYLTSHQDLSNYVQKSETAGLIKNDGTIDTSTYLTSSTAHQVPSGGNSGQVLKKSSGTDYDYAWANQTQDYPSAYCKTAAGTAGKSAACTLWTATANTYLHIVIVYANTSVSALTLNVNSTSAAPLYINGVVSSSTNYTLPAGSYIAFYDGTNWYINTDGTIPNVLHKSSTSGLVKNDGTIDTNTYLTSHQDISGKEDKVAIEATPKTASFTAVVDKYYFVNIAASGSVTITLTTPSDNTHISSAVFRVTTSTSPALTFAAATGVDIYVGSSYSIEASKVYEINALWNGTDWSILCSEIQAQS